MISKKLSLFIGVIEKQCIEDTGLLEMVLQSRTPAGDQYLSRITTDHNIEDQGKH
jgi:hypothetical protein